MLRARAPHGQRPARGPSAVDDGASLWDDTSVSAWNEHAPVRCRGLLQRCYTAGALLASVLCLVAPLALGANAVALTIKAASALARDPSERAPAPVDAVLVSPPVPGIVFPAAHAIHLLIAIIVSLVLHEWGHALSARVEGVPVHGFGVRWWFVVPVAYVEIDQGELELRSRGPQARIFSGGIAHNLATCVLCFAAIACARAAFADGAGVYVSYVAGTAEAQASLACGQRIQMINGEEIAGSLPSVHNAMTAHPLWCVDPSFLSDQLPLDASVAEDSRCVSCCARLRWQKERTGDKTDKLSCVEIPSTASCALVRARRAVVEARAPLCSKIATSCSGRCVRFRARTPVVRLQGDTAVDVLFQGTPQQLQNTFELSIYHVPEGEWSCFFYLILKHAELLLAYTASVSLGLGILNAAPVYQMDGEHILCVWLPQGHLTRWFLRAGTSLLVVNVLLSVIVVLQ